ncbi:hypothetical protein LOTGIDRAFT_108047 [Lottia gigantea]|uniref:Uncharacterized protein n=1 Tax=Lottia gigantea TaxID=225164 RepID=V3ZIA9_LOTGI|nr:hypothetical protein LOTGIDRAFT_108047 [Lottia gigantea]ESO83937.1 hypothetical protein LOTGIDRAFT_108047 [Lottia gigantea]
MRLVHDVSCKSIIEGDESEIAKAESLMKQISYFPASDLTVTAATQDCAKFHQLYGYDSIPNSNEERDFPLAYNILFYKDVAQIEMLLRAIYKPQNYYCLHVDGFAPESVHTAASALANCFENVFIASRTENIVYKSFARLQADINCMSDHLDLAEDWKYLINLPGQEYPLKTNQEIVKILKIYNNANDIEGILGKGLLSTRYIYEYKNVNTTSNKYNIISTNKRNPPPPHRISIVKGSAYGVFTRGFVDYVINNQTAKDFLNWCKGVLSPDEYYWATLNHNPHLSVPGSKADEKDWLAAFASWKGTDKCRGRWQRGVCVFGVGDLNYLISKKHLFANKFVIDYQPLPMQCLSEWLTNKTMTPLPFDSQYYKQLPFINNHF